ncbi:MarR family winged helix-turn-helix transcriptional regulator [Catellatospora coxensis]
MSAATDALPAPADRQRGVNFGWSLGMVLRRWQEFVEEVLQDLPHGSRGYHILAVVVHEDVPTQGALATRLVIDRSVLTYVIDDLEAAGLIERQLDPATGEPAASWPPTRAARCSPTPRSESPGPRTTCSAG